MANSKLLKDAIADAKTVRETAIANAKIALEEAFTPKLQSILSKKLQSEMEGDDDEEDIEDIEDIDGGDEDFDLEDDTVDEDDDEDELEEGEGEDEDGDGVIDDPTGASVTEDEDEEELDEEEDEDDLDLEAIIRELEDELGDDEEEISEEDEDEFEDELEEDEDEESSDDIEFDDEIDLDEILREMGYDPDGDEEEVNEDDEEDVEDLKADLEEANKTIKILHKTINEVNLLNAKLLFTNKLFRSYDLSKEQKMKVVETLDRTSNVREVKLVYATLSESFRFGTAPTKKNKSTKLTESFASAVSRSTKPAKDIITEGNTAVERFKKLANIN